jgi:hypothetical protein
MAYIEMDVETFDCAPLSGKALEEAFAIADEAEVDPSKVIDRGPGGVHYYDDCIGEDVVQWCFDYARKHPEDEYIQTRVRNFQTMNRNYRERSGGRNMPGYDTTFFPEDAVTDKPDLETE